MIVPGSGQLIGQPPKGAVSSEKGDITLNFANAEVTEVVRSVLGDVLNVNYVISPKVQGTVTVRTSQPLTRAAVLPTLQAILQLHGVAVVKVGDLYQVIPAADAPRSGTAPVVQTSPEMSNRAFGIEVVPLKYIAASQMEKTLKSVAPDGSVLYVDTSRNVLLLGGTPDELASLMDLIAIFDVDVMRGMSFALIPLEHSDAQSVEGDLERVFNVNKDNAGDMNFRFMPITRLNAILVVSTRMEYINHAREWIRMLDHTDEAGQKLYVYYIQNGRAKDIAAVLGNIFGATVSNGPGLGGDVAPGYKPASLESPIGDQLGGGLGNGGLGGSGLGGGLGLGGTLGPGIGGQGGVPLAGVNAPQSPPGQLAMAPPSKSSPTEGKSGGEGVSVVQFTAQSAVRIVADPNINALVIYASSADYQTILSALRKIDIAPMQVLIEATIAEVSLTGSFSYGLEWFFNSANVQLYNSAGTVGPLASIAPAFSYLATAKDIQVTLNAIAQQTDVKIISSPQLLVLDNQTARIQVGDQVPVLTQQAVSTITAGAPVVNSVEYIDAGVILDVTPHVNSSGLVMLDIAQQLSEPTKTDTSDIDSPTIQQRMIKSSVAVQTGETVTLGGLISDKNTDSGEGLPALRRIPVVGSLFGVKGNNTTRTELLVLLTPKIVHDWRSAREVSYELGSRMRLLAPLGAKIQ